MTNATDFDLKDLIRTIPDYPKKGIMFRDITTLIADPRGLDKCLSELAAPYMDKGIDLIASIEARGFIFGTAVAQRLGCGFIPVRKPGKLPGDTIGQNYELEYGTDRVEIHHDAISPGAKVLLIDDLIATGGTAEAAIKLIRQAGGVIEHAAFVVDLPDLGGVKRLETLNVECTALMEFEGD